MASPELHHFLAVLQSGDRQAVEALLCQLDPFLRQSIHLRLLDGRLRHVLDTADIFQSLLKDFLAQKERDGPPAEAAGGLAAYLAAAVHHKIQTKLRKERRHAGSLPEPCELASPEPPGAQQVEAQDFSQALRARLSEPSRRLFELKAQGLTWTEIAEQVGGKPDTLRMRLSRAVATVLRELNSGTDEGP